MSALGVFFKEVADAIRTKKGTTDTIVPINFPQEILEIETGITPEGDIEITTNGTHDVTNYANAIVNVASSGSSDTLENSGEISVTAPASTFQVIYHYLNDDGTIKYGGMPLYLFPTVTTYSITKVLVGSEIFFVTVSQDKLKYRDVVVTGGLEVLYSTAQDYYVVRVTSTEGGTITITDK